MGAARRDRIVAVRAYRLLREPTQKLCGVRGFASCLNKRLAHLAYDLLRDLIETRGHEIEAPAKELGALARRARSPVAGGGMGGIDGGDPVRLGGGGERRDDRPVGGVEHVKATLADRNLGGAHGPKGYRLGDGECKKLRPG